MFEIKRHNFLLKVGRGVKRRTVDWEATILIFLGGEEKSLSLMIRPFIWHGQLAPQLAFCLVLLSLIKNWLKGGKRGACVSGRLRGPLGTLC